MSGHFPLYDGFKGKGKLIERTLFDSPKTKRRKLCLSLKRSRELLEKSENLGVASSSKVSEKLEPLEYTFSLALESSFKEVSALHDISDSDSQSFFATSAAESILDSPSQHALSDSSSCLPEVIDIDMTAGKIESDSRNIEQPFIYSNDRNEERSLLCWKSEAKIFQNNIDSEPTILPVTNPKTLPKEEFSEIPETAQLNDNLEFEPVDNSAEKRIESLSEAVLSKLPYIPRSLRKGENVFTKDQVKKWSTARIHAWENRYTNPDAFYYRFVDPEELQANGGFNKKDHEHFMARLKEFKEKGYRIGSAWGIFSMGVPHKAGYQCSSYYRKLIEQRKVEDPSYVIVNGKLSMVEKGRKDGRSAEGSLSVAWNTVEVQEIEKNVNQWLKEFHNRDISQVSAVKKVTKPKSKAPLDSAHKSIQTEAPKDHNPMLSKLSTKQLVLEDEFEIFPGLQTKPATKSSHPQSKLLQKYKELAPAIPSKVNLLSKSSKASTLSQYMDHVRKAHARKFLDFPIAGKHTHRSNHIVTTSTTAKAKLNHVKPLQRDLSAFWQGVKSPRVEGPEPPIYKIPFEIPSTWAKKIVPTNETLPIASTDNIYMETNDMLNIDFNDIFEKQTSEVSFEGVLIDPPWELLMADDDRSKCYLQVEQLETLLERVLKYLPMGLLFIWTHKILTPDVVHIMMKLDCRYVENLAWFKKRVNNTHTSHPSSYFRRSKETLLIFKKGDGFDIRHQRTADVVIDFEKPKSHWIEQEYTEPKPAEVYEMIETLLPNSKNPTPVGSGRLLELWCKRNSRDRPGWVVIHENKENDPTLSGNQSHVWYNGVKRTTPNIPSKLQAENGEKNWLCIT